MRRPPGAGGWPYGRLPWARGLRVARTARAHTRSVGGRAADNPRRVAHGQASSQGWRQNKFNSVRVPQPLSPDTHGLLTGPFFQHRHLAINMQQHALLAFILLDKYDLCQGYSRHARVTKLSAKHRVLLVCYHKPVMYCSCQHVVRTAHEVFGAA